MLEIPCSFWLQWLAVIQGFAVVFLLGREAERAMQSLYAILFICEKCVPGLLAPQKKKNNNKIKEEQAGGGFLAGKSKCARSLLLDFFQI